MAKKKASIVISAAKDAQFRRILKSAIDDIVKGARAAALEEAKAAKQAATAKAKAARDAANAKKKATREEQRAVKAATDEEKRAAAALAKEEAKWAEWAEREKYKAVQRTAALTRRESERTARSQMRDAKRVLRDMERNATNRREVLRKLLVGAGAAYGAGRGVVELVGRGQGVAGVTSLEDRLSTAGDFRQRLIQKATEAGLSDEERKQVEASLLATSEKTNVSISDMVAGLDDAQTRFDRFRDFAANMGSIAEVAAAKGETVNDLVGAIGTAAQQFQLDSAGIKEFVDALVAMAERGTLGAGEFSREFAPSMGSFVAATHRTGIAGAREFMATGQTLGTSQAGAAESATMMERLMEELQKVDTQAALHSIGIDVTQQTGKRWKPGGELLNMGEIFARMAANDKLQHGAVRGAIFKRIEARRAVQFGMGAIQRDPEYFTKLQDMPIGAGEASVANTLEKLHKDPLFELRNVGVHAQTETVRDADRIVNAITPAVKELTEIQSKYPLITESMNTLEQTIRWAVGALITSNFLIKGGGAVAEAGGVGAAVSQMGWFGKYGLAGAAGLASYGLTSQVLKFFGGDDVGIGYDIFKLGGTDERARDRGMGPDLMSLKNPNATPDFTMPPGLANQSLDLSPETIDQLTKDPKAEVRIILQNQDGRVTHMNATPGVDAYVDTGSSLMSIP